MTEPTVPCRHASPLACAYRLFCVLKGGSKKCHYYLGVRKYRLRKRSVSEVNEGFTAELKKQMGKKCIFKSARKIVLGFFCVWGLASCISEEAKTPEVVLTERSPQDLAPPTKGLRPPQNAFEITNNMGAGWNLGNTLDAFGGETAWGNPKATQELIDTIQAAGFKTLRVPVSWDNHVDDAFNINPLWMARVEQVVNYGLNRGMYVILNVHHNRGWQAPTAKNSANASLVLNKLWHQIAYQFSTYDYRLIFEVMNEPRVKEDWTGKPEYYEVVNALNAKVLPIIRSSGGNNASRMVMMPGYVAGGHEAQARAIRLPKDPMVVLSVHAYFPYHFSMKAKRYTIFDNTVDIDELFPRLDKYFLSKGRAVVLGEWASANKNNLSERIKHAEYFMKAATKYKIPMIVWDNNHFTPGKGEAMGLYDRHNNTWPHPKLRDAIINNAYRRANKNNVITHGE